MNLGRLAPPMFVALLGACGAKPVDSPEDPSPSALADPNAATAAPAPNAAAAPTGATPPGANGAAGAAPPPPGAGGLSAVKFRSSASSADKDTTVTRFSVGAPDGTMPGDVLIAAVYVGSTALRGAPKVTSAPGWTVVDETIDKGSRAALVVEWRVAAAGDPSSWAFTIDQPAFDVAWIAAFEGAAAKAPIDAHAGASDDGSTTTFAAPVVTTTTANALLVATFVGHTAATSGALTLACPKDATSITSLNDMRSRAGCGAFLVQPAAGKSTALAMTSSTKLAGEIAHLLAIRPAP